MIYGHVVVARSNGHTHAVGKEFPRVQEAIAWAKAFEGPFPKAICCHGKIRGSKVVRRKVVRSSGTRRNYRQKIVWEGTTPIREKREGEA